MHPPPAPPYTGIWWQLIICTPYLICWFSSSKLRTSHQIYNTVIKNTWNKQDTVDQIGTDFSSPFKEFAFLPLLLPKFPLLYVCMKTEEFMVCAIQSQPCGRPSRRMQCSSHHPFLQPWPGTDSIATAVLHAWPDSPAAARSGHGETVTLILTRCALCHSLQTVGTTACGACEPV